MERILNHLEIDAGAIDQALAAGMTFPAAWYTDPEIHRIEVEDVFRQSWQIVCFEQHVVNPGDHAVGEVGDVPVVIVRGDDGVLRGFINVCRHRAFPVAECSGNRKTLQCRYHAWTYDLDGSLRAAPRSEHEPGFDRGEFGLLPISIEVLGGFVWGHTNPNAPSLAEEHPALHGLVEEWHIDANQYSAPRPRTRYDIPANWKIFVENNSECYHCPTVHEGFGDAFDVTYESYTYVNEDRLSGQTTASNQKDNVFAETSGAYRFIYIWPGTFIEVDEIRASWMKVRPVTPESCAIDWDVVADPAVPQKIADEWDAMYLATMEEDYGVVAAQQQNMTSRAVPYGRLMASSESSISHFHHIVWQELRKLIEV